LAAKVPPQFASWFHTERLPMPDQESMRRIEEETDALAFDDPPGPLATVWLSRVEAWAAGLVSKYQQDRSFITGSWRANAVEWEKRLRVLPDAQRRRVMSLVKEGCRLPFDSIPPSPLRSLSNHPQLHERCADVWQSVREQIEVSAVEPWDCAGRVDTDVLPLGMYPIRWVAKSGSDRVRITINMRPLNSFLSKECASCELGTLHKCRHLWQPLDYQISFDARSAYYHQEYGPVGHHTDTRWLGFSIDDFELPPGAVEFLQQRCPEARWGSRWVFTYRGLAMGCSPSSAVYVDCFDALMAAWRTRTVSGGWGGEARSFRSSSYIDDSLFLVQGFAYGVELGLNILAELIICGMHVNVAKSSVLPRRRIQTLGVVANTIDMSFSLPPGRCIKLRAAVAELRRQVISSPRPSARAVAKLVGSIWSIEVTCHKAVAIMARSMYECLAGALRQPWLRSERDPARLKRLLRLVWCGDVPWSSAADAELAFWESVDFDSLRAPISFDAVVPNMRSWVYRAEGPGDTALQRLEALQAFMRQCIHDRSSGVRVFASDTSDSATGAVEASWREDCSLVCKSSMVSPLSAAGIGASSTYRELEGILKADLALVPAAWTTWQWFRCCPEAAGSPSYTGW
jgi:hypothetical protein